MSLQTDELDPLFDLNVIQEPYEYYKHLRETDPVHEVVGTDTYLVTSSDLIHHVVSKPKLFSSQTGGFLHKGDWEKPGRLSLGSEAGYSASEGSVLATVDPPDHTRQRKVVARKLSTTNMRAMEPEFRELVEQVLDQVGPEGRIEWMSQVAEPLPVVMVARILGIPDSSAPDLKALGYDSIERISGMTSDARLQELDAIVPRTDDLAAAYGTARQDPTAYPGTMIAIAAQAVAEGIISDVEAFGIFGLLIAAGGESTTSLTGAAVKILCDRPDLQDELRANPALIPAFIEEALRFEPPFRGHYRVLTEDAELGGKKLKAGAQLVLMWPAANRDESVYEDPDEVRLDRENRYHVGFGWGIHLCVGAPLARVEAKAAVETLLARTRSFKIDPEASSLPYHVSLMVRRLVSLPLILELAE